MEVTHTSPGLVCDFYTGGLHVNFMYLAICEDVSKSAVSILPESADISWYFDALGEGADSDPSVSHLSSFIMGVSKLVARGDFVLIDNLATDRSIDSMSNATLVSFVRSLFPVRSKLKKWMRFIMMVGEVLEQRGKDPKALLRGIL